MENDRNYEEWELLGIWFILKVCEVFISSSHHCPLFTCEYPSIAALQSKYSDENHPQRWLVFQSEDYAVHWPWPSAPSRVQATPVTQLTFLLRDLHHFLCSSFALYGIAVMWTIFLLQKQHETQEIHKICFGHWINHILICFKQNKITFLLKNGILQNSTKISLIRVPKTSLPIRLNKKSCIEWIARNNRR